MKKGMAYSIISILAVAVIALGLLYFINNNEKSNQIASLNADITTKEGKIEGLIADIDDKEKQIKVLGTDYSEQAAQIDALNMDMEAFDGCPVGAICEDKKSGRKHIKVNVNWFGVWNEI